MTCLEQWHHVWRDCFQRKDSASSAPRSFSFLSFSQTLMGSPPAPPAWHLMTSLDWIHFVWLLGASLDWIHCVWQLVTPLGWIRWREMPAPNAGRTCLGSAASPRLCVHAAGWSSFPIYLLNLIYLCFYSVYTIYKGPFTFCHSV